MDNQKHEQILKFNVKQLLRPVASLNLKQEIGICISNEVFTFKKISTTTNQQG